MHNQFLKELSTKPIINTFKLSYKMLGSNKILFSIVSSIFILLSSLSFLLPFSFGRWDGQISIMVITVILAVVGIVSQVFTESNYLYISKIILESNTEAECVAKIENTKLSTLFFMYFFRALSSFIAILIMVLPFIFIREKLYFGTYWDNLLIVLLVLASYVYSLVAYKIMLSNNFKEAFLVTFSFFSPTVWKQSFHLSYAKFIISMTVILYTIYNGLLFSIENMIDVENTMVAIIAMAAMTVVSMFLALYVLPISMMFAQSISVDK